MSNYEILTGPKGGKYYIDEKGRKKYINKKADSKVSQNSRGKEVLKKQKSRSKESSEGKYRIHTITIADYEHSGDIDHEIAYIKSVCPKARNIKGWEERDYEAESDYEQDYGECDEPIYQGYVSFEAPIDWDSNKYEL